MKLILTRKESEFMKVYDNKQQNNKKKAWGIFLKDVLICSLGSYGGPEVHFGVFIDQMVIKKKYLTEKEFADLIALTGILPGPSSTQTIVSIGYKFGGPYLAFLTLLVWAMPVITIMTLLSFLGQIFSDINISKNILRYIGPMAVGFIIMAAITIGKRVVTDKITVVLFIFGAVTTYIFRQSYIFPLVLISGAVVSVLSSKEKNLWNKVEIDPPWKYLVAFFGIMVTSFLLSIFLNNIIVILFEKFYRFGYLVIGGGQVVIPFMHSELVEVNKYMTNSEFLTGFGLVQGLPGPMFSFSAYAGGMASRGGGTTIQLLGAVFSAIGIFLPGLLLIYFIYPVWDKLKEIKAIEISLKGITAVAVGLIFITSIILMQESGFKIDNIIVTLFTILILYTKKIPAPLIVLGVLILGLLI